MNLKPPPRYDTDPRALLVWLEDLYEFLKYPVFAGPVGVSGLTFGVVSKTTTYTVALTDDMIKCNGTFTVTLPAVASTPTGKVFYIKNIGTGTITVDGNGSETIDDQTTQALTQYDCMVIMNDGTEFWIV